MTAALARIMGDLNQHKEAFDLDKNGLAEMLMDVTVDVIERLMDREVDPDGNAWAPLSEAYATAKARIAPGAPIAVLTHLMKFRPELEGMRRITAREATMVYGISEQARQEASWFQEGTDNQPPRRFYELGDEAINELDRVCRAHLDRIIKGR